MDKNLLETLKKRAADREASRLEIKEFNVGGIPMKFKKLSQRECLSYYARLVASMGTAGGEDEDGEKTVDKTEMAAGLEESVEIFAQLIYESCPALQDSELLKETGAVDPFDIVWKLMDISEINKLGNDLTDWMGILKSSKKS